MESSQILILVTVFVYLVGMLLIGVYFSRRGGSGSSHDFYLGGRSLGPVVTAMSAEASDMSSYLLMGIPGLAYFCGLPEVTWTCIGLATGTGWGPSPCRTSSPAAMATSATCSPASRRS